MKYGKLSTVLFGCKLVDFFWSSRLLISELVARESQDLDRVRVIRRELLLLLVDLNQLLVAHISEASLAGDVHTENEPRTTVHELAQWLLFFPKQ